MRSFFRFDFEFDFGFILGASWVRFGLPFGRSNRVKLGPGCILNCSFFENVDFVKIVVFLKEICYFSRFEPRKIDPKLMQNRTRKKHRKKISKKLILASILASRNVPKSSEILPKSDAERSLFRDAMQPASKSPQVNGNHRL